jgi:hypothetical protein
LGVGVHPVNRSAAPSVTASVWVYFISAAPQAAVLHPAAGNIIPISAATPRIPQPAFMGQAYDPSLSATCRSRMPSCWFFEAAGPDLIDAFTRAPSRAGAGVDAGPGQIAAERGAMACADGCCRLRQEGEPKPLVRTRSGGGATS